MEYSVVEIFKTIQGEGCFEGVPSIIVRFSVCNLNCIWCDEKDKITKSVKMDMEDILNRIDELNCENIILTGGEPFMEPYLRELTLKLKERNYFITIETNGTIKNDVYADLISISPKLTNSGLTKMINTEAINYYLENYMCQLKFVVEKENDFIEMKSFLKKLDYLDLKYVIAMPLSNSKEEFDLRKKDILNLCIKYGVRFGNRLQLQIWNDGKEKEEVVTNE